MRTSLPSVPTMVAARPLQVTVVPPGPGAGGGVVPGAQLEMFGSWVSSPKPSLSQSPSSLAERSSCKLGSGRYVTGVLDGGLSPLVLCSA